MPPSPIPAHLIISTHTPRHLRRVLRGALAQRGAPEGAHLGAHPGGFDSITVSCDADDPAIADVVAELAPSSAVPLCLVQRPHTGRSRSSQVRNNAVRARLESDPGPGGLLVFLDGDCVPAPDLAKIYRARTSPRTLAIGFRHDLTPEQTEDFDEAALAAGRAPVALTREQIRSLHRRASRYRRQAALRMLALAKPHKPKLLSANFALWLDDYRAVNGFDEAYEGYGQEDDDLGRRLYRFGCRPVIAIEQATVYHQHHPTRAPGGWHDSPNAARFAADGPTRCVLGLDNPSDQPTIRVRRFACQSQPVSG